MSDMNNSPALQYRLFDGPEDAPVLILGPSLGTTWQHVRPPGARAGRSSGGSSGSICAGPRRGSLFAAHPAGSVSDLADRLLVTLDALRRAALRLRGLRALGGAVGLELVPAPPGAGGLAGADRPLAPLRDGGRVPASAG
ncbi:hypothetical protein ACRAWF_24165 [Streptomyces sp. L7]